MPYFYIMINYVMVRALTGGRIMYWGGGGVTNCKDTTQERP